jgi:hypothetical protein
MNPTRTPYAFARVAHRAFAEHTAGELDVWELALLGHLYDRLKLGSYEVRISLPRLAEVSRWPFSLDYLSKTIRRLRRRNWLRYRAIPGRRAPIYCFELWHEPGSEHGPSWDPRQSEESLPVVAESRPSRGVRGPSSAEPVTPPVEPDPEQSDAVSVRAVKTFQETPVSDRGVNNNPHSGTKSGPSVQSAQAESLVDDESRPPWEIFAEKHPELFSQEVEPGLEPSEGRLFDPGESDRSRGEPEG